MKRNLALTLLLGALAVTQAHAAEIRTEDAQVKEAQAKLERCKVDNPIRSFMQDLPNSRAAILDKKNLTIVALGSSSTAGTGASSPETSYPAVLQAELIRRFPGVEVNVVNRGVGGNNSMQMYHRMKDEVLAEEPNLVIWQTGVNDAINDIGIDKFKRILRKGIAALKDAKIDVMLMDHQPLPRMERYPLYIQYLAALREVAVETGTPVFKRFDVMNQLLKDGKLRQDEIFSTDSLHMVDHSYYCVATTLAQSISEKIAKP